MLKHVEHILIVFLLVCLCMACSNTGDDAPVQESHPVQVGFTLSTGGGYGSRALPGENGETAGTGFENYIDIANRDFRFYIFDADNKFVTELKVLMVMPMDNSEYPSVYHLTGELGVMPPQTFKVVAIANWPKYPASTNLVEGQTTIEDICEASEYDYVQPFVPSAKQKIPMYGVRTYTGKTFKPNLSTELEEIYMLRAMAKVEVKLSDDLTGYTLGSAKITNFSGFGMAAPINIYDQTDEDCTDWETMHIDHADVINTGSTSFPISDGNSRIVYLPEYKNVDVDYPSYITVTLNGKEYDIYFRNYVEGKPTNERINIVRNHHYVFTITQVGAGIEVAYTVADWLHEEEKHHWTQQYSYPTYENVIPWTFITNGTDHQAAITTAPTMYYVASNWNTNDKGQQVLVEKAHDEYEGAFEVAFKMTGPDNQEWTPAIHGSETDYAIRVYRQDEQKLVLLSNGNEWVSGDKWYKIQLIPKDPNNVDHEFEFGITTTLTSINQTMYLLINGEDAQTIRWPNSGSDARIIRVKQVSAPSSSTDNENNG